MSTSANASVYEYVRKDLPAKNKMYGFGLTLIGIILLGLSYSMEPTRASYNTIIVFMYLFGIGLGSLFFIALEYIVGAVWSVPFRRIAEILSKMVFIAPLFAIPIYFNMHSVFEWTHLEEVAKDAILTAKAPYLNEGFFWIRTIAIFVLMIFFYLIMVRPSFKQDLTKNPKLTSRNAKISAVFIPIFAISTTVIAMDWMMSLEPHWFSTIYGVYYFAGSLLTVLALIAFIGVTLGEKGFLTKKINGDHYYNLGALLFAFVNFWAYIAFSQYMLIWYANIPEETFWFIKRWGGSWSIMSIGLIFIKFAVPYFILLSRPSKSSVSKLKFVAIWILAAHFYDLYWLIMPRFSDHVLISWHELAAPVLLAGVMILLFNLGAGKSNLLPINDPKLKRGLDFYL